MPKARSTIVKRKRKIGGETAIAKVRIKSQSILKVRPDINPPDNVPMINEPVTNIPACDLTREQITNLMLESHRKSANSGEEIMALKEIAKLNGFYDKIKEQILTIDIHHHMDKLQEMTDEELLRLGGGNENMFALSKPIEAEFEAIDDENEKED